MAKRIRVVTSTTDQPRMPAPQVPLRNVITADQPMVVHSQPLTQNERRARQLFATTTFMGRKASDLISTDTTKGFSSRTADVIDSGQAQFYSPQLSTDFLEKPQNLRERRAFYRFFYNTNEIVRRAIDIHTNLPLSKIRLVPPKGKNKKQNEYVFKFFETMCDNMRLFKSLIELTFEFNLMGNAASFAEDSEWHEGLSDNDKATKIEKARTQEKYLKEKFDIQDKDPLYKGWRKLIILPPDQVRIRKLPLTDEVAVEYMPDPETRKFLTQEVLAPLDVENPQQSLKYSVPEDIKERVRRSGVIPLDTDPNTGSHVHVLTRKKSQYEPLGISMIEPCTNTLVLLDKLRQAQTSIASRHMTPMRIVWAEELNNEQVDNLREQVDMALVDPDFSIIANYEVHWEEMGSQGRLLDLTAEYETGLRRLCIGMGVTEELLTGSSTYTSGRIALEIMNTEYLLYREIIQDYVENNLFKPVARRKGFIEYDEFGNEVLLYPKLSFTRLAIRDNEQFFDAAFQLYQKGSISVDLILDILNIDPGSTREKLEKDMFTVNDSIFNEALRNIYTTVAAPLVEKTDIVARMAQYMQLNMSEEPEAPPEGSSRFSSEKKPLPAPEIQAKAARVMKYLLENPQALERVFGKVSADDKKTG